MHDCCMGACYEPASIPEFVFAPFFLIAVWLLVAACAAPVRWSLGNVLTLLGVRDGVARRRAVRILTYPLALAYLAAVCVALGRFLTR